MWTKERATKLRRIGPGLSADTDEIAARSGREISLNLKSLVLFQLPPKLEIQLIWGAMHSSFFPETPVWSFYKDINICKSQRDHGCHGSGALFRGAEQA